MKKKKEHKTKTNQTKTNKNKTKYNTNNTKSISHRHQTRQAVQQFDDDALWSLMLAF